MDSKNKDNSKLPYEKELTAAGETFLSFVAGSTDFVAGIIPMFQTIVNWENNRKLQKLKLLVENLKEAMEENTKNIEKLMNLGKNPKGNTLLHRVIKLNDSVEMEDEVFLEFIKIQTKILINVSKIDFEELFSELNYSISRLEKLSPQAIYVMNDFSNWPKNINIGGTSMSGVTLSGDWAQKFTEAYLNNREANDLLKKEVKERLVEVMSELKNNGCIDISEDKHIVLTEVGESIYEYLLSS